MPQGVEHIPLCIRMIILESVKLSLMPQGVEHAYPSASTYMKHPVKLSLMPQGVEHADGLVRVGRASR